MNEGEFKKEIRLLQKRLPRMASFENPLFAILDEAQKEFPFLEKFVVSHPELKDGEQIIEECLKAQEQWFQKWFGDTNV